MEEPKNQRNKENIGSKKFLGFRQERDSSHKYCKISILPNPFFHLG
jgi:hypothetical protein